MQTLGISDSTPQSENRLRRLFWPSIQSASDVDALGTQGYWVCAIVAAFSLVTSAITGHPIGGVFVLLFYYLGGVGVREHSFYAAVVVLAMFIADTVLAPSIPKIFLTALLISNVRATWISSNWKPDSPDAAMPMRFDETWGDKFVDKLPRLLWPKVRVAYYIFSAAFMLLVLFGSAVTLYRRHM
jgi:hypothetical protein